MLSNSQVYLYSSGSNQNNNNNNINNKPPMYENYHHHPALVCSSSISASQSTTTSCATSSSATSSTSSIVNSNIGGAFSSNGKDSTTQQQRHQFQMRQSSLPQQNQNPQNSSSHSSSGGNSSSTSSSSSSSSNPVQIQNYITWINSHLKKRPGLALVENLQTDLCSGVTLTYLIEIIAATTPGSDLALLRRVNMSPKSVHECRDNVEIILRFMQSNSIKMHQTTAREICDGNLKAIMRLVLALAAHFKPTNVQPYSTAIQKQQQPVAKTITQSVSVSNTNSHQQQNGHMVNSKRSSSTNNINYNGGAMAPPPPPLPSYAPPPSSADRHHNHADTMTHLVQAACVNLVDVRRFKNENFNVKYVKRNKLLETPPVINNETYLLERGNKKNSMSSSMSPSASSSSTSSPSTILVNNNNGNAMSPSTFVFDNSNSPGESHPIASSTVLIPPHSSRHLYENMVASNNNKNSDVVVDQEAPKKATRNLTYTLSTLDNKENQVKQEVVVADENKPSEEVVAETKKTPTTTRRSSVEEMRPIMRSEAIQNDLGDIETLNDVLALKNILIDLQAMFMNESNEEDNGENTVVPESTRPATTSLKRSQSTLAPRHMSVSTSGGLSKDEQIAILKSRIQQLEMLVDDLRGELSDAKSTLMTHSGLNSGLKSRITEQNQTILQMKNDEIKLNMDYAKVNKERDEMSDDMTRYMERVEELTRVVDMKNKEIEMMMLLKHPSSPHDDDDVVGDDGEETIGALMVKLRAHLSSVDSVQLMDKLEKRVARVVMVASGSSSNKSSSRNAKSNSTTTTIPSSNSISTSVSSLISSSSSSGGSSSSVVSSSANSPVLAVSSNNTNSNNKQQQSNGQQSVDSNESNVKKIISRLLSQNQQQPESSTALLPPPSPTPTNLASKGHKLGNLMNTFESSSSSSSSSKTSNNNNNNHLLAISSSVMSSNNEHTTTTTKCIYHMDSRSTPYMITIAKPLGAVTLSDLKQSIKLKQLPPGVGYVFRFKTVDPEFGVLKEEVSQDYKPLPLFENKIVAWIETGPSSVSSP